MILTYFKQYKRQNLLKAQDRLKKKTSDDSNQVLDMLNILLTRYVAVQSNFRFDYIAKLELHGY